MPVLSEFRRCLQPADALVENSTKEDLAECARLLALNVAHYQSKYGELPLDETLAMVNAVEPNEEQALLLSDGMEVLVGVLGGVLSGLGEEKH